MSDSGSWGDGGNSEASDGNGGDDVVELGSDSDGDGDDGDDDGDDDDGNDDDDQESISDADRSDGAVSPMHTCLLSQSAWSCGTALRPPRSC